MSAFCRFPVPKKLLSIGPFLAILGISCSFGQSGDYSSGGRSSAIGTASVTLSDAYSLFNNPAGLAKAPASAFVSYENRYQLENFQVMAAGANMAFGQFSAGAGFYRFGGKLYNEQIITLKAANQIGFASLGAGFSYVQYNISSIGTRGVPVVDLGAIAEINRQLLLGAHIYNLTQSYLAKSTRERVPTVMQLGLSYRPVSSFMLNAQASKDIDRPARTAIGMEYLIIPPLALRTGFITEPFLICFGLGFQPGRFQVDYAFRNNTTLGNLHQMSVKYVFKSK